MVFLENPKKYFFRENKSQASSTTKILWKIKDENVTYLYETVKKHDIFREKKLWLGRFRNS